MKLSVLEAIFLKITDKNTYQTGVPIAEAQGISFLCPKCFNDPPVGSVGTHSVMCWFRDRGVPDDLDPKPGRWNPSGTGILLGGCDWHGFIKNGDAS